MSEIYKRIDNKPDILLYNPTFKLIGNIGLYTESQCSLRFNDKSELSFKVPYKYFDNIGNEFINPIYNQIKRTRLLHIPDMGWWYIEETRHNDNGIEKYCEVTAYSYEHTLTLRSVNLYSANQSDTGVMVLTLYDILTAFKEQTGWNLPQELYDRPSDYMHEKHQFDIELNTSWYDFLKSTVQDSFDCFVFFDYESLSIDIKLSSSQENLRQSNIVLSFDNLIKDLSVEETSQRTATALYVTGKDCNIIDVNPLGTSIIYNFSPYLSTDWMSQETISAINEWQNKIKKYEDIYKNLTGFRNFLIDYRVSITTQITEVETQISKHKDLLSLNDTNSSSSGLRGKYGESYKLYSSMKSSLLELSSCLTYAINVISSNKSNCYNDLSNISDYAPAFKLIGTGYGYKYDYFFNEGSMTGSWKEYRYIHTQIYEALSDINGDINIFKLNNNIYGNKIIEYYNTNGSVPTIQYITKSLSWGNNFTVKQLKEISKYIVDASYNVDTYTYYAGNDYINLINPFESQIGCVTKSYSEDAINPDDKFTYGLGYWTTNFINLPSGDDGLSIRFFNKETGGIIKPYDVNLYHETKMGVIYFCDDTAESRIGYQLLENWNDNSGQFTDGTKPKYLRASFKYPTDLNSQENVVPIMDVVCSLGTEYKNLTSTNISNQSDLKEEAMRKHKELCLPCKSFTINVANFLKLDEYKSYADELSLGTQVKAETTQNVYEDVRLLDISFSFDEVDNLNMTFANKYGVNNDKIMFRKLVGSKGDTFDIQNSFTSFSFADNSLN